MRNTQSEREVPAVSFSGPSGAVATRIVRVLFASPDGTVVRKTYNCSSPTIVIGSGVRADLCITKPTLVPEHIVISFDSQTFTSYGPDVFVDGKGVECGSSVPFSNSSVIRLRGLVFGFYTTSENKEEYWRALDRASSQPLVYSGVDKVAGEPLADSEQVKRTKTNDGVDDGREGAAAGAGLCAFEASGKDERREVAGENAPILPPSSAASDGIKIFSNGETVITDNSSTKETAIENIEMRKADKSGESQAGAEPDGRMARTVLQDDRAEEKEKLTVPFSTDERISEEIEEKDGGRSRNDTTTEADGQGSLGGKAKEEEHAAEEKSVSNKVVAERIIEEEIHRVDEDINRALGTDPDVSIERRESPDLGRSVVEKGLLEDAKRELKENTVKSSDIAEIKDEVLKNVKDNIKEDMREDVNEMVQEEVQEKISGAVTECLNSSVVEIADKVLSQIDNHKSSKKSTRAIERKDREVLKETMEASAETEKPVENTEEEEGKSVPEHQQNIAETGEEEKVEKWDAEEEAEEERPVRRRGRRKKAETAPVEKEGVEEQPATAQRRTRRAAANAARKNMKN